MLCFSCSDDIVKLLSNNIYSISYSLLSNNIYTYTVITYHVCDIACFIESRAATFDSVWRVGASWDLTSTQKGLRGSMFLGSGRVVGSHGGPSDS